MKHVWLLLHHEALALLLVQRASASAESALDTGEAPEKLASTMGALQFCAESTCGTLDLPPALGSALECVTLGD
jgi:hypothetical protein